MSLHVRSLLRLFNTSSHPLGSAVGDMWWRNDLSQAHGSDGGATPIVLGPTGNLPVVRSTGWHSVPPAGSSSAITPVLNRAYALPVWPGKSCNLTGVAAEVTLLGVGNLRSGLYADNGASVPGTLIADFGTVATGLAGVKTWTPTPVALRPVLHWLVLVQQGIINVGLRARDTWDPLVSETSSSLSGNRTAYFADGVSGTLPASFGSVSGTTQGPSAIVQLT
jgi:hypothetical protein